MKLGLFDIMQVDPSREETVREMFARRLDDLALADTLGFEAALFAERHFLQHYAIPSATAWIAAASQRTSRMRLGALAYTLPIKAPVQLAEDIAMLDHLSGGRLEVGFGLGHRTEELEALGQDPQRRVALFQRRLAVLRALWSGGAITVEQDDIIARSLAIHPLPLQQPYPPLWFAGTDPGAAQWMGAQGLGLAVGFRPTAVLAPTVGAFRAGQAQRQPDAPVAGPLGDVIGMRNVYIAETDEAALEEITDDLVLLSERMDGSGTATAANRAERRATQREAAERMMQEDIMIAGGPETVAVAIRRMADTLDLSTFLASVYAMGVEDERLHRSLHLLAGPIRQHLAWE